MPDLILAPLDFDGGINRYRINIQVSDNGVVPNLIDLPVYLAITPVNEYDVVFTPAGPYTRAVDEDMPINTLVMDVVTTDLDRTNHPHGDHRYSLLSGDPGGQFAVDSTTGI